MSSPRTSKPRTAPTAAKPGDNEIHPEGNGYFVTALAKRHIRNKTGSPLKGSGSRSWLKDIMVAPARATSRQRKWHTFLRAPYHILTTTKGRNIWQSPTVTGQNRLWLPPPCPPETDGADHPDLYLLRDAAADEAGAIADYLACAAETCLDEIFLDVAEDEMEHYAETMRLISWLDRSRPKCSQKKLSTCW